MARADLNEYLRGLEKRSEPSFNDRTYPQYVNYINGFLSHFGKERVYLVGSTTERLKVRWSKDAGDADFLLLSGKLEVPVENVKFRADTPCIIWVKVNRDDIDKNISLIDDKYLPSDVLRSVGPELFTILRGIYLLFTSNTSYTPRHTHLTTYGIISKVGLSVSQYRELKVDNLDFTTVDRTISKRPVTERDQDFKMYIHNRKQASSFRRQDINSMKQALEFISSTKIPGSVGTRLGYFEHFAYISGLVLERFDSFSDDSSQSALKTESKPELPSDDEAQNEVLVNDFDSLSEDELLYSNQTPINKFNDSKRLIRNIRATYMERTCKDFVPAIKLVGQLPCMEAWKNAEHRWLSQGEIEAICNMDVFFVARYAPVNPSRKDFCLSFTLAENKLSECLSPVQRRVALVMKAYLKGLITKRHQKQGRESKLTTFHLKTILYRVCDITDSCMWSEENILVCIVKVVEYLQIALSEKELLHYFIPSNLFAAFENEDLKILLECVEDILKDPIGSIKPFFDLDDGIPNEIWLTEEEVSDLEKLTTDGGIAKEVDRLEEVMVEILRGLNEGPRDSGDKAPLSQAISTVLELFVKDEVAQTLRRASRHLNRGSQSHNTLALLVPFLSETVGAMFGSSSTKQLFGQIARILEPFNSEEEKQQTFESLKYLFVSFFSRGDDE